jgi:hypothetical protein
VQRKESIGYLINSKRKFSLSIKMIEANCLELVQSRQALSTKIVTLSISFYFENLIVLFKKSLKVCNYNFSKIFKTLIV